MHLNTRAYGALQKDSTVWHVLGRILSPGWQMPIALAAGGAILIGYSLQLLVSVGDSPIAGALHSAGAALVWVSLGLGMIHGTRAAVESIMRRELSIDILMVVGACLAAGIGHPSEGALLLFMFTLAEALEHRALTRARDAVARLHRIMPQEALRRDADGHWVEVRPEALAIGDEILVRAGEMVPADAVVLRGSSTLDQSALTGESLPRTVDPGDTVYAGTLNQNGALEARVTRPVAESSLQKILTLVTEAQEQRQPIQRLIDRFATPYTAAAFAVAGLVFVGLALFGTDSAGERLTLSSAAYRAITLLIVASPCALVIATPTATLCGLSRAARAGLLVKGGDALERLAGVQVVAIDKTGTLTTGRIEVLGATLFGARAGDGDEEDSEGRTLASMLGVALSMEQRSTHPVAAAIVRYAQQRGVRPATIEGFHLDAGKGVSARSAEGPAALGAMDFIEPRLPAALVAPVRGAVDDAWRRGSITAVMVAGERAIVFELADSVREGAEALVSELRRAGVHRVCMLTGDSATVAATVAARIGIDERDVRSELLPEGKVERVRQIKAESGAGRLAVIGDGVNDAPALAIADIGLAMGGVGADAALETADVVILNDDLRVIPWAFELAHGVQRVMKINLAFAAGVIVLLAALTLLGWIPMGIGVIGHEGSTLIVVANSLQILAWRSPRSVQDE
jgi:Cd2+/Zn2+-exporting ATPase